ncbi:MAG: hypothetical protein P4N41_09785 [Negativicutes bacterium]|nr:hypothetical protein [Negativicutes bacterium]
MLVAVFIAPWIAASRFVDRKRLCELVLFGALIAIETITMDEIGYSLFLWTYPVQLVPFFPRLTSMDYSALPIIYVLIYQYCNSWWSFFRILVIFSAIAAFLLEPALVHLNLYFLIKWYYWYSFPIYIVMGLATKWIVCKILAMQHAA